MSKKSKKWKDLTNREKDKSRGIAGLAVTGFILQKKKK